MTMPMINPPHPGKFIKDKIIDPAGLTVKAAAGTLDVAPPTLSHLLNCNADLSPEMALRIEQAFGVSMDTLMRMQQPLTSRASDAPLHRSRYAPTRPEHDRQPHTPR